MFLIFGLSTKAQRLGLVPGACPVCRHSGLLLLRETTRFSLFFVPLFPVRKRYVAQCVNPMCGHRSTLDRDSAERLLANTGATI